MGTSRLAAVATFAAAVAALAAVLIAGQVAWQLRQDARHAGADVGVESVWQLREEWTSSAMLDIRAAAATSLLANQPSADVDEVLDFFAELALLVDRGAIDEQLADLEFYWPLATYWSASRDYVQRGNGKAPAWAPVEGLLSRLSALEARRKQRAVAQVLPSPGEVRQFLQDEQGNDDECTDDSEVQKTPL